MSMQKIENCTSCEFYQEVQKEEDKIFAMCKEVLKTKIVFKISEY